MADSGWYPDPSNDGLERYWDGSAWSDATRPKAGGAAANPYGAPQYGSPQYGTPQYGSPEYGAGQQGAGQQGAPQYGAPQYGTSPSGGAPYGTPPYGSPQYGAPQYGGQAYGTPGYGAPPYGSPAGYVPYGTALVPQNADYGKRVLAYLIDAAIVAVPILAAYLLFFVLIAAAAGSDNDGVAALGVIFIGLAFVAAIGFTIWNHFIRQGRTGQTVGKSKMGIRLVRNVDQQPIGGGMAFVRWLVPNVIGNFTCGIFTLLDLLWPLWDENNQRLTDKWFNWSVIPA